MSDLQNVERLDPYLAERRMLSERYGPQELWHVADAWPLYVGIGNLTRCLTLYDAFRQAQNVPGDIVEFGTWRGATLMLWAKLLAVCDPLGHRRVHGFDRWSVGFEQAQWTPKDLLMVAHRYAGTYAGDLGVIEDMVRLYGLGDRVVLHRGLIEATWPEARKAIPRVALALLDVDLYEPTAAALDGLHERLSQGAIIVADEYGHPDWPGETMAVDEFLDAHAGQYQVSSVRNTAQPTLRLVRR
jgi:hypothetical protein